MRKIIGVVALVAGFVLVASPPVYAADSPIVLTLYVGNGAGPTIANGAAAPAFTTTTVGSPVSVTYMFDSGGAPAPVESIDGATVSVPAGFTVTQAVLAQGNPWPGTGATRQWILRCDALLAGTYAGTVTVSYTTASTTVPLIGPGGSFSFTVSCQVNAPTTVPAATTPASVAPTPASVAPATKKKPIIPATGSSPVLPLTATLMVGLGAISIRLARRREPV